jgi:hypothetical protein
MHRVQAETGVATNVATNMDAATAKTAERRSGRSRGIDRFLV